MSRELRFMLPMPLDVEPVLEGLLSTKTLSMPFRARSQAAGDFVAKLIRDEAARRPAPSKGRRGQKPPEPEED